MELLESVALFVGGLFIRVAQDGDVDDDGGDASNDVVVADLACRRDAVKHRWTERINLLVQI